MLKISASFSQKCLQIFTETLISSMSAVVFLFLDCLDVVFCVFFRLVDEFLEGKRSHECNCSVKKRRKKVLPLILIERMSCRRLWRNVFREMGFLRNCSKRKKEWRKVNENIDGLIVLVKIVFYG